MNTQLQLPSPLALEEALHPLTEALLQQKKVQALYLTEINLEPRALYNLLIVVDDTSTLTALRKRLPALQVQFPAFALQAYTHRQVREGLQKGALYFLRFYRLGGTYLPRRATA